MGRPRGVNQTGVCGLRMVQIGAKVHGPGSPRTKPGGTPRQSLQQSRHKPIVKSLASLRAHSRVLVPWRCHDERGEEEDLPAKLAAPFPEHCIQRTEGRLTGRGYDTTGIGYQFIANRLNEALGVGGWRAHRTVTVKEIVRANGRPAFEAICDITLELGEWIDGQFIVFAESLADGGNLASSENRCKEGQWPVWQERGRHFGKPAPSLSALIPWPSALALACRHPLVIGSPRQESPARGGLYGGGIRDAAKDGAAPPRRRGGLPLGGNRGHGDHPSRSSPGKRPSLPAVSRPSRPSSREAALPASPGPSGKVRAVGPSTPRGSTPRRAPPAATMSWRASRSRKGSGRPRSRWRRRAGGSSP